LKLLGAVVAVMIVVAALDFAYQRFKWRQRQRMSIRELKEEFKQQEGSPEIKAKVRQIRRERARRRMMSEVPNATVVVTNPTHFAVALKYESGMAAPVCVAKGIDAVALRIRAVAEAAGVTVVENPPLARVLHATVDLDEEIPPEHYKAVAQIIGYVMGLKSRRGWAAV
jgi:flagellar biosynthetic protein FlhB